MEGRNGFAAADDDAQEVVAAEVVDEVPDQPLLIARYSRDYALELVDGTGWEVVELHPPEPYIQHYIVCRPV